MFDDQTDLMGVSQLHPLPTQSGHTPLWSDGNIKHEHLMKN